MKIAKLMMPLGIMLTVAALLAISAFPVMAQGPVTSPLSGDVTIDDDPAPDGSEVAVYVGDEIEPRGTTTTTGGTYETLLFGAAGDVGQAISFKVKKAGTEEWLDATTEPEAPTYANYDPQVVNLFAFTLPPPPPEPVAEFSASPLSGDEPLTVVFTDASLNMTNNPTYSWDFGDGGTSTEPSPTHQYLQDGSYTVTLTATTDDGTDTEVKDNYIVVADTDPVASFTADPISGDYPLEVSFADDSTSHDGIISYEWDFSYDGVAFDVDSTEQNPTYTYETEGIHTVALRVTEEDGDSDIAEELITVTAPGDVTDPVIEYAWLDYPVGAESARPGDPFVVAAVVTDDTAVTLVEVETPFGTLALEAEEYEEVTYYWVRIEVPEDALFGTYELTLRAADAAGNEDTQSLDLEVVPVLTAYNIWLTDGWNLISLPLIPDVPETENVTAGLSFLSEDMVRAIWGDEAADWMMADINTIWYYDAGGEYGAAGQWLFFEPASEVGDLTEMEDGKGYWVEVVCAVDEEIPEPLLTVYGVELQSGPQVLPPSYMVVEGWNLIGFKETNPMEVAIYLSAVDGKYARIYGYDAYEQYFYLVGEDGRGDMQPGAGYWIYMTDSGYIVP